jgi:hypothetical protein
MATMKSASVRQTGNKAAHKVERAATGGWIEGLERWGYVARGLLYIIMGSLALQLAMGAGGQAADPIGALRLIARQPYGKVLLVAMVVGLAGYSLWGLVRALFDPLRKGHDLKGLGTRVSYLISAISYGVLIVPALQLLGIQIPGGQQSGDPRGITAQLMSKPYGLALVYLFGLFWLVAGASQLVTAYGATFMRDLRTRKMSATEQYWARLIGRLGYAARGVVYLTISVFVFRAASTANPQHAQGFSGALMKLAQGPYGQLILAAVAAGLVLFGVYSVLSARWYTIDPAERG